MEEVKPQTPDYCMLVSHILGLWRGFTHIGIQAGNVMRSIRSCSTMEKGLLEAKASSLSKTRGWMTSKSYNVQLPAEERPIVRIDKAELWTGSSGPSPGQWIQGWDRTWDSPLPRKESFIPTGVNQSLDSMMHFWLQHVAMGVHAILGMGSQVFAREAETYEPHPS